MAPAVLLLAFALAGGIAFVSWWNSEAQQIKRALRQAQRVDIAQYPHGGYKRVIGELGQVGRPLQAPMSGRPCAAWQVVVEEKRGSGKSSSWHEIIRETKSVPFTVTDETGKAYVDPQGCRVVITQDRESSSGVLDDPTEEEQAFLDRHGRMGEGWLFNKTLRYYEGVLEEGEDVAVLGHGIRSYDHEAPSTPHQGGYREQALGQRLDIRAPETLPFYISDDLSTVA